MLPIVNISPAIHAAMMTWRGFATAQYRNDDPVEGPVSFEWQGVLFVVVLGDGK